ncbi:MAG TPA: alpha/beta hydrolase [Jatrophihabitans sp.]|nr:alpha/beta hydrolase [Jatrophihabitans sp.]
MPTEYQQLRTEDGRVVEYLVGGRAGGRALLFHVGTPGCATQFSFLTEPATELGLQVICYSRPGYAGSSERPGRTVADAVDDVAAVLDELSVSEFLTLGWSGGGPHALACAALLPERCQAAATLGGVAPYRAHGIDWLDGMDQANLDEFGAAVAGRAELEAYLAPAVQELAGVSGDTVVASMAGLLPPVDQQALTGQFGAELAEVFRRMAAAGYAGWRDDDLAFIADWGFRCADIRRPVAVWQGQQDRMVPFSHGQWLAAEIPGAEARLFAEEGHVSLLMQARQLLIELIAAADAG